jgi:hypothetical protein
MPADLAAGERAGIFVATAVFMVAIVAALVVSYVMTRHLPVMPLVTAIIVLVFGSLTLVLHDEHFIKLKPTIIYLLFGGVLLGGLAFGKPLLSMVFDSVFHLTDEGLAQADGALGAVLLRAGGPQRDRVAHAVHRCLGQLQGVRSRAADVPVRRLAVSAAHEIRRAGGDESGESACGQRIGNTLPRLLALRQLGAASAFSIAGFSALSRLSDVMGPISL